MWPVGFFFPIVFWPMGFFPLTPSPAPGVGGSSLVVACAPDLGPGYALLDVCHPLPPSS